MIFAMYVIFLGMGHLLLCKSIKSDTIRCYLSVVAKEIQCQREAFARQHPERTLSWFYPLRPHGSTTLAPEISVCLDKIKCWEDMQDRHEPLTVEMIHHQHSLCLPSTPFSVDHAMRNWFVTGIYASFCLSEWAQEDHICSRAQVKLTQEGDPTAFLISDLEFFGQFQCCCTLTGALCHPYLVQQVDLRWRYQKNQMKNEKKTFICIHRSSHMGSSPTLCAVSAWLCIVQWWHDLCLPNNYPLAVFTTTSLVDGPVNFLRPTHINATLHCAAQVVYNITKEEDLAHFSSHSIHVGACVSLHTASISQQDIKFALCWKSDSFMTYLHNLPCQSACTAAAVINFSPNTFSLIPAPATA